MAESGQVVEDPSCEPVDRPVILGELDHAAQVCDELLTLMMEQIELGRRLRHVGSLYPNEASALDRLSNGKLDAMYELARLLGLLVHLRDDCIGGEVSLEGFSDADCVALRPYAEAYLGSEHPVTRTLNGEGEALKAKNSRAASQALAPRTPREANYW